MLFPTKENANEWVRIPNGDEPFRGKSALDKMLSGNIRDFKAVREYLDSMRSGWL